VLQGFQFCGFGQHDEPDNQTYKYQCVASIFLLRTLTRVSIPSANHQLERRVLSSELLRRRVALEQGILIEIFDYSKDSLPEGIRPYHWVGAGGGLGKNLGPGTYIHNTTTHHLENEACVMEMEHGVRLATIGQHWLNWPFRAVAFIEQLSQVFQGALSEVCTPLPQHF
jgi:hypothetical protein